MICKKKIRKLTVFVKDDDRLYEDILNDFLSYRITIKKVLRDEKETKVWLIDTASGLMVLKVFVPKNQKIERFLKSFIKRDYYESLIYKTDNAINKGADFINDIYFIAQRKILNYAYMHIILMEYIEGVQLAHLDVINDELKSDIKTMISKLHSFNMVSGYPHLENIMLTNAGPKLIDLSGKRCDFVSRAKDFMQLERYINIKNDNRNLGYYAYTFSKKLKSTIKSIKIKLGLRKKHNKRDKNIKNPLN